MADPLSDEAARLRDIAKGRRGQLARRLGYGAVGSLLIGLMLGPVFGFVCLALIVTSQSLDEFIWRRIENKPDHPRIWWRIGLCSVAQSSFFYGSIPASLWTIDDAGVKAFAGLWLAGSILHTTMHLHQRKTLWLFSTLPHIMVFAALPIYSYFGDHVPLKSALLMLFGIFLYLAHITGTFRLVNQSTEDKERSRLRAIRQREEARSASEAKSAFLATMSHEIRTPLNGVIGLAETLCTDDLPEDSAKKAETIRSSGILLLDLLNDILDVSKIEAGRFELENAPFDLDDVAAKVVNLHAPAAQEKGVDLEISIAPDLERMRIGDQHRILQIFHNLLSNAIKFTSEGRIAARISADERDGWLRIEVADTGLGMNESEIQKVMEPFVQADSAITRKYGGTGLGLSIVRGIVEIMGGKIAVRSRVGEGATITIAAPLPVAATAPADASAGAVADALLFSALRVLVVDDNKVNQMVATSLLSPLGVDAEAVGSGAAAIDMVKRREFDVILMDIAMPDMDGVEAMRAIRAVLGETSPPIIAASAHALKHEVEEYLAQGFDGYLTKPVTRDSLRRGIERALNASLVPASARKAS